MDYHEKIYDLYVVLGSNDSEPIWNWFVWQQRMVPLFESFVNLAREKAAVRTIQFDKSNNRPVSFGRIAWNENGHSKWTHGSPRTLEKSRDWAFLSCEVWAPSWSQCERDDQAPDFFLEFTNANFNERDEVPAFGQTVIAAIAISLPSAQLSNFRSCVVRLATTLKSPLTAYQRRAWGKSFGASMFTDTIQNMASLGLFKVGNPHKRPLNLETFQEKWEPLTTL